MKKFMVEGQTTVYWRGEIEAYDEADAHDEAKHLANQHWESLFDCVKLLSDSSEVDDITPVRKKPDTSKEGL